MPAEPALEPVIGAQLRVDEEIAALAAHQHGVVGRRQLLAAGLGRRAIGHRVECGRLHVLHRGVYAVGHRVLSREGWWMAAVLAAGEGAVLSHRSAAMLWGIRATARSAIEVSVPRPARSRPGITVHAAVLPADEVTVMSGIPVTTSPRTLLDLAAVLPRGLEPALNEAEVKRLTDPLSLAAVVARYPGRRGVATVRRVLDAGTACGTIVRSRLERRFLPLLDRSGLPRPQINAPVKLAGTWLEVDLLWRSEGLIAELDGFATHGTRQAFERDRARDRALQVAGWRVVRITWRQLLDQPDVLAAELAALLAVNPRLSPS